MKVVVRIYRDEALAHRLERLAEEEGTSLDGLLRRLLSEHVERRGAVSGRGTVSGHRLAPRRDVCFPLIPKEETRVIRPVTGADIDGMFALDDLAS